MNEREYHKKLLIQKIESHRGTVDRELQNVRDANPLNQLNELREELMDGLSRLGIGLGSSSRGSQRGGRHLGLDLSIALPVIIQIGSALLRKRKSRS